MLAHSPPGSCRLQSQSHHEELTLELPHWEDSGGGEEGCGGKHRAECLLEVKEELIRLGYDVAIEAHRRQHARRDDRLVGRFLLTVAEHGDFADLVGDLRFL